MENILEYLKEQRNQSWREELRKSMKAKDRTGLERVHMPEELPEVRNKSILK